MVTLRSTRGFTYVEILTVLAIITVMSFMSLSAFRNVYRNGAERVTATEIADALREARNKTLSAHNDMVYGVRVGTSSVTRFVGSTYVEGNASNTVFYYEGGATATGTLVTNAVDIVFTRLTGAPSATGTIYVLDMDMLSTTTITLDGTGLVQ
jgi:Tfp pilus assembly protein FimT